MRTFVLSAFSRWSPTVRNSAVRFSNSQAANRAVTSISIASCSIALASFRKAAASFNRLSIKLSRLVMEVLIKYWSGINGKLRLRDGNNTYKCSNASSYILRVALLERKTLYE